MAIVSNSSPLILFSKAARLYLLREVFGEVFIPEAVFEEVVTVGEGRPGAAAIAGMPWIKRTAVSNRKVMTELAGKLGRGEAEAIALAVQLGRKMPVLIDDRRGRRLARELGVRVVGSVGLLVQAKEQGLIPFLSPVLEELRSLGLYLSDSARREVLTAAGELPTSSKEAE